MAHRMGIVSLIMLALGYQTMGQLPPASRLCNMYFGYSFQYLVLENSLNNLNLDVPALKTFLREQSREKRNLAIELMEYQHMRGMGRKEIKLEQTMPRPSINPTNLEEVLSEFSEMEDFLKQRIVAIHEDAIQEKDFVFAHRLISHAERETKILNRAMKLYEEGRKLNPKSCKCQAFQRYMC